MIWHVQQNVVTWFMILLPRFSYIYWLIHFNVILFCLERKYILEKMTYLSSHCYMGEIEYCIEEEDWVSLASSFKNEQCYIPLFRLLTDF